jgi:Uma2 family endonuclease
MTIATIGNPIQQQPLNFDEFFARYGGDNRYELIDGEVFDSEPTGLHEEVAAFITTKICVQIDRVSLPWFVLQRGLLRPANTGMTAFRPDVTLVDGEYEIQPLHGNQPIVSLTFPELELTAEQVLRAGG